MRMPLVAGNWKMNTTVAEAVALVDGMMNELPFIDRVEKVICPPSISLEPVRNRLAGSSVLLGAQNAYWEPKGAFTGEISMQMLVGLADYVIVGHSERRQYFHETDDDVNRKVKAALGAALRVIMCVGEPLSENEMGHALPYVEAQVRAGLAEVGTLDNVVIAYEPIWAIGTGRAATVDDASRVITHIRKTVREMSGETSASEIRILYGGSISPDNFPGFVEHPEIDGGLVGGASLSAGSFLNLVRQAAQNAPGR